MYYQTCVHGQDLSICVGEYEIVTSLNVIEAFTNGEWIVQFRFVSWYTDWLNFMLVAIGRCPCAEHRTTLIA